MAPIPPPYRTPAAVPAGLAMLLLAAMLVFAAPAAAGHHHRKGHHHGGKGHHRKGHHRHRGHHDKGRHHKGGGHRHHRQDPPGQPPMLGYNDNFNQFELHTDKPQNPLTGLPLPLPWPGGGGKGHTTRQPSGGELIKQARAGGADVIRYVVPWARVERERGTYDWKIEDATYQMALKEGLKPVIVLFTAPCWAHPSISCDSDFTAVRPDSGYLQDYGNFVRAAIERYPQAAGFEIWNESNLKRYWGPKPTPLGYVRMLRAVHGAISDLGPHPPVLYNGLTPKPKWRNYLKRSMFHLDAGEDVDGTGVHPYVGSKGVNAVRGRIRWVRELLRKAKAPRATWITEIGWSTDPDAKTGVTTTEQAARIDRLVEVAPKLSVKAVIIHRLPRHRLGQRLGGGARRRRHPGQAEADLLRSRARLRASAATGRLLTAPAPVGRRSGTTPAWHFRSPARGSRTHYRRFRGDRRGASPRELAGRGHDLIIVARRKPRLDELAAELSDQHGVRVETLGCDLGKPASRSRLPAASIRSASRSTCSSTTPASRPAATSRSPTPSGSSSRSGSSARRRSRSSPPSCPAMVERKEGAILNVASTAAFMPLPYSAGYSAAKAHSLAFSEALHGEVAAAGSP